MENLEAPGPQEDLDVTGFNLVGYGCTTCNGNSGLLPGLVADVVYDGGLVAYSVLPSSRYSEGRVNPLVKANYLALPPLVVTCAIASAVRAVLYEALQSSPAGP